MMLKEDQIKLLMLMHDLEKEIGELYRLFSEKFPDHAAFWDFLAKEEGHHAEAIRRMYRMTYGGEVSFDPGKLTPDAVLSILDYVRGLADNVSRKNYSHKQAVSHALGLEQSLLEREMFSHFSFCDPLSEVLSTLEKDTRRHATLAREELERIDKASD